MASEFSAITLSTISTMTATTTMMVATTMTATPTATGAMVSVSGDTVALLDMLGTWAQVAVALAPAVGPAILRAVWRPLRPQRPRRNPGVVIAEAFRRGSIAAAAGATRRMGDLPANAERHREIPLIIQGSAGEGVAAADVDKVLEDLKPIPPPPQYQR
ncbi:hypothetical protein C8A03DRAFT_30750 [Achaetomium macrosporum]|uniref:Uncharacterized protein n=1 Tax=Achaetomium macrosporum TaxID=79813 RepID=A0AAN7CFJ7_9PEZI|nr:hypothetical protein C8A03DRAFT_30750 [Achaetomium macrosporum]